MAQVQVKTQAGIVMMDYDKWKASVDANFDESDDKYKPKMQRIPRPTRMQTMRDCAGRAGKACDAAYLAINRAASTFGLLKSRMSDN